MHQTIVTVMMSCRPTTVSLMIGDSKYLSLIKLYIINSEGIIAFENSIGKSQRSRNRFVLFITDNQLPLVVRYYGGWYTPWQHLHIYLRVINYCLTWVTWRNVKELILISLPAFPILPRVWVRRVVFSPSNIHLQWTLDYPDESVPPCSLVCKFKSETEVQSPHREHRWFVLYYQGNKALYHYLSHHTTADCLPLGREYYMSAQQAVAFLFRHISRCHIIALNYDHCWKTSSTENMGRHSRRNHISKQAEAMPITVIDDMSVTLCILRV